MDVLSPEEVGKRQIVEGVREPLLGAHMPTTGGIQRAIIEGADIGCQCVQLFTSSPQQWKARSVDEEQIALFSQARNETGLHPIVVHDSYLINLASGDDEIRAKSIRAFQDEMERCESFAVDFLVTHCGACGKETEAQGLTRLAESIDIVHHSSPDYCTRITLEVTAGQGTSLGYRFEHIRRVLDSVREPERLGVCLDTCHVFAAGYDLRGDTAYESVLDEFDTVIGLERLCVIHANDCKKELGSRVDRHEHIGRGQIGAEAFRLLVRDKRLRSIPKIVETPDFKLHGENLRILRALHAFDHELSPDALRIVLRDVVEVGVK